MVYAALAAIAVAHLEGVPVDDALARLAALAPTPGRLQAVELRNGATLLRDDYKSPVETIDAAIDVLEVIPARRRIVLLGDISEPPNPQHATYQRIGERVGRVAAHFLVAGQHDQGTTAPGRALAGWTPSASFPAGDTPGVAAASLAALLEPGDVVLVKGRDTQRLARVCLILQGRRVGCEIPVVPSAHRDLRRVPDARTRLGVASRRHVTARCGFASHGRPPSRDAIDSAPRRGTGRAGLGAASGRRCSINGERAYSSGAPCHSMS